MTERPGLTITLVETSPHLPAAGTLAIRKWENHGLAVGTHRLTLGEPHPRIADLIAANNRAHDRKVRLSAALIHLVEHFERVDACEADRRAIHLACQVWAGVKAEDVLDGRSAANPCALQKAIANLRDSIAEEIPFGLTYVNSDDLAVVMDAVELATPARAEVQDEGAEELAAGLRGMARECMETMDEAQADVLIRSAVALETRASLTLKVDEGAAGARLAAKPLDWRKPTKRDRDEGGRENALWIAPGLGGEYAIQSDVHNFILWRIDDPFAFDTFPTVETAKAHAEADWQKNIGRKIAALKSTAAQEGGAS